MSAAHPPMVETDGLTKRYSAAVALHPCRLQVPRHEVFGLLGPNGAGKTTLIRLLMGFLEPTAGAARIDGLCCFSHREEVHRRVAYLPGEVRLFGNFRGRDVLKFFASLRGRTSETAERIADRLGLDLSRRISACSSGMRQKAALAVAFAAETPLLILDEPTTHLDPTARGVVLDLVREARDAQRTVLFSSHIFSEVEEVCSSAALVCKGRLVHQTTIAAVRRRHRIQAALRGPLGDPPPQLSGRLTVVEKSADRCTLECADDLLEAMRWLVSQPLADVQVEPLGLQSLYQRYASDEPSAA